MIFSNLASPHKMGGPYIGWRFRGPLLFNECNVSHVENADKGEGQAVIFIE